MEKFGGRKLAVSLLVLVVGLAISLYKGDIPPNLLNLLEMVIGAFVGGNVLAKALGVAVQRKTEPLPPPPGAIPAPADLSSGSVSNEEVRAAFNELGQHMNSLYAHQIKSMDALTQSVTNSTEAMTALLERIKK